VSFHFRPATRENTPLVVGIAGPTKSGKTLSALRLAVGIANGGPIAMVNAEGAKGHQYADRFDYLAADIQPPYRPGRYTEALQAALAIKPAVVIFDSMSHMHDGPGGLLEYHEEELDRLAGTDERQRLKKNWTAWIRPKAAENEFIYELLGADCHVILCFRAKEKLRIISGREPENLGWQPIAGDRITFETLFTLILPPHSKGVPDLALSEMREPFDTMIPRGQQLSEETGQKLAAWAKGSGAEPSPTAALAAEGTGGAGNEPAPSASDQTGPSVSPRSSDGDSPTDGPAPTHDENIAALNALVTSMAESNTVTKRQVWVAVARMRSLPVDEMIELLKGRDDDGLHWSPLRDSLEPHEAAELRKRLGAKWAETREAVPA